MKNEELSSLQCSFGLSLSPFHLFNFPLVKYGRCPFGNVIGVLLKQLAVRHSE